MNEWKNKVGFGLYIPLTLALTLTLTPITNLHSGDRKPVKPGPKDKCPVCGMFVAKYPDWVAQIQFKDGSYAFFDGVKDLIKYTLNLKKYNPSKKPEDIDTVYVTDYYSLRPVDGLRAFYIVGSDVYGPMGKELVPFEKEEEAREFMRDHRGKWMLKFQEVTADLIRDLN